MADALPPDYYRDNFRQLLDFVAQRYGPLLAEPERSFYERFSALPAAAQRLFIRLLSRRGALFLQRKLDYPEIADLPVTAERLSAAGLLAIDPPAATAALLRLFNKAEIARKLRRPELARLGRAELDRQLLEGDPAPVAAALRAGETLYQPLATDLFATFQLCFFGNLHQDLTDFVLRDLGLQRYENYRLDAAQLPFRSRRQIEAHLCYYRCQDAAEAALASGPSEILALWQSLPPRLEGDAALRRRVERLTNALARQLERLGEPERALTLYEQCRRPPARERRARILVARGEIDRGLALCRDILEQAESEEERVFAQTFGLRTATRHERPFPLSPTYDPPVIHLQLRPEASPGASVESAAAAALSADGPCHYVENRLVNGVLGLFIWDIVFAPVPGAFYHPFQRAPADFYEPGFLAARRELLERRLAECQDPAAMARRVFGHWRAKHGLANPLVHWEALSPELLQLALERLPPAHWRALFERMLADLRHHRSGLPDLIAFPTGGSYRLVEVKAPGDRLQKNQLRWMAFFAERGIPHAVAHVSWLPA